MTPPFEPHYNGMPARALGSADWHSWSGPNGGTCLEVKRLPGRRVALRQSADAAGPALVCALDGFAAFVEAAKRGDADFLLTPRDETGA
ncbi:DUF397 domain-containing protein [Streptomyces boncukensis]|uniref:DUF397 domain-containing protein n=1 Tax=Streptomyces boncukensis TaxID=2711219 RepID=A0A6G4X1G2_9ACTN|nr:DUF397 domain-containing protein [Streptomyces boncukensis]NGO71093.1 DUF397 domain-containing protein [Streptomyces boncukensis]